jgi:hypothetical protein
MYHLLSDSLLYRSRLDRRIKGEIMYPTLDHMTHINAHTYKTPMNIQNIEGGYVPPTLR